MVRGGTGRHWLPCLPAALPLSIFFFICKGSTAPAPAGLAGSDRAAGREYRVYWQGQPPLLLAVVLAVAVALGLLAPCIYKCCTVFIRLSSVKTQQAGQLHKFLCDRVGRAGSLSGCPAAAIPPALPELPLAISKKIKKVCLNC